MKPILKNILSILMGALTLMYCACEVRVPKKPLIIVNKYYTQDKGGLWVFKYIDKNGEGTEFHEKNNIYRIGDTIK